MNERIRWTLILIVFAGWAGAARAADEDPFAGDTPPADVAVPSKSKVPPAPASAPPVAAASVVPGVVEELPAAAYPEPVTRGLYGGPLWLDMQGLQWPYMRKTGIGISGSGWIDANTRLIRTGNPAISPSFTEYLDQGRFVLRVTPTYTNGFWFVQAQAELVANTDQFDVQPAPSVVSADDVWVRAGLWNLGDVTFGRMQGFDVYPLGMGLDLNTYERLGAYDPSFTGSPNGYGAVPALYNAEYLFYRSSSPRVSDVAIHIYVGPLRFELLNQGGNDGVLNVLGVRPAAILDLGFFKLRAAGEYQYKFAEDPAPTAMNKIKNSGVAGSAQFVWAPFIEAGVNVGYASIDVFDQKNPDGDKGLSGNRFSVGGFVDVAPIPDLMIGAGINYATFHNILADQEESTNQQRFLAVQYIAFKQLYLKLVGAYAKSHFQNLNTSSPYDDDMFSVRFRVMYLF